MPNVSLASVITPVIEAAAPTQLPSTLSLWSLFWSADPVVKIVIVGLVMASIWSWSIIFAKILRMRHLASNADAFEEAFWSGHSIDTLYDRLDNQPAPDPFTHIFCAAMREWRRALSKGRPAPEKRHLLTQKIERIMQNVSERELESIESRMGFLASVGSVSPFIGLFGTVWGIMNSFQAIAASQNTNLTVVAPAIAEALFATALGLVAAIPAVMAYNKISGDINRYGNRLDTFVGEFSSIITRQLDEEG